MEICLSMRSCSRLDLAQTSQNTDPLLSRPNLAREKAGLRIAVINGNVPNDVGLLTEIAPCAAMI